MVKESQRICSLSQNPLKALGQNPENEKLCWAQT